MAGRNLGFDVNAPGTALFIIQVLFLFLAWIAAFMRGYVKVVLLRRTTTDDYVMLLALIGYTATGYFVFSAILDGGLGMPRSGPPDPESLGYMLRGWFGNMVLSGPVSGLARVSIALFLLRIAVKKWQRMILHTVIVLTGIMTTVYFFIVVFQCSPPSYFWQRMTEGAAGSCELAKVVQSATFVWGSFAAAMDWVLGLLPIAMLWHVRINKQSKVGIAAILSFGILGGVALVIRLVYIAQTGPATKNSVYGTLAVSISAVVELALGIIAGCVATLPPLFKKLGLQSPSSAKREALSCTIPWQRSFAGSEARPQGAEEIIMMSPRRLERARDRESTLTEARGLRTSSPSAKRVLSSGNWDIEVDAGRLVKDGLAPPPSGKDIKIRTHISVNSIPSSSNGSTNNEFDSADKPLPAPPPRKPRDRSISRSRSATPNLSLFP